MTQRDPDFKFAPEERQVPVWDLGVRFFHWALVLLVITSFVTAKIGGNALTYHAWSGYTILTLLLFRVIWGLVGGTQARFTAFIRGPGTVIATLKGMFDRARHQPALGHNAMGGLSVLAMLLALLFQAGSGLFVNATSARMIFSLSLCSPISRSESSLPAHAYSGPSNAMSSLTNSPDEAWNRSASNIASTDRPPKGLWPNEGL